MSQNRFGPKVTEFIQRLHLARSDYHGQAFEGRQCRIILNNVPLLREIVGEGAHRVTRSAATATTESRIIAVVQALDDFKNVVDIGFGMELGANLGEAVQRFKTSFLHAGIYVQKGF